MSKAQVGDLIRIVDSEDAPIGRIYEVVEVDSLGDAYVDGTFDTGYPLYFCDNEYVIHRKAGEEESDATPTQDVVNHPNHYTQGKFETIEVIEEITSGYDDGYVAYCVGNALKYEARAPFKHDTPLEDLRKAAKYLAFAIDYLDAKSTQD